MKEELNYFQILGLTREASSEDIRNAYFELARQYHPDANPEPLIRERFLQIQEAYSVLSNSKRRMEYEATLAPLPAPAEVSARYLYSRRTIPVLQEPQLVYVLLELANTSKPENVNYPPVNLSLVIDRSTSMKGERMDMVKANILQSLKLLKPQDLISVVTFSDRAEVIIPPSRMDNPARFESRINSITPGGSTELKTGLQAGLEQFNFSRGLQTVKQLILFTDGHTYGDEDACIELAKTAAGESIAINAFGLGHEWNDTFLDRLTGICGGNTLYVTSRKDAYLFLEQKLRSLGSLYAQQLQLMYRSSDGVELRYAFRMNPEAGPIETASPIMLGDLQFGKKMTFLFEFLLTGIEPGTQKVSLADGRLSMKILSKNQLEPRMAIKLERPVELNPPSEPPPDALIEAMSRLSLYRLQEKARQEVATGDIGKATRHLQYLATHLLSQGNRDLAHSVLLEAEHIQKNQQFSSEGDKRIKYGTRALMLPSGLETK